VRARDLERLGGTPALRLVIGSVCCLDIAGVELSGRGDSVVGGGDDIVGEADQSAPDWLWQRDQLIGRDLAACCPGDAFVAGLALLDRDLGLPLGPHADDARRSGQTWVIGWGVPDDVGDVDGGDHAEMKGLDRVANALPSSQKKRLTAQAAHICGKTCRPAIPKASPRTLAVAARSALGHPVHVGRGTAPADPFPC
jgi:hypothetical protein